MRDWGSARRKLLVSALLIVIVGCCFSIAETVARRLRPDLTYGALRARIEAQRYLWSTPDAEFHHVGDGLYGLSFRREVSTPGRRILIVGDSFTMGHGVEPEQRFAAVAGRLLDRTSEIDVLAVPGYSPIIYRNIVRRALESTSYELIAVFVDQTDPADDLLYRNDLLYGDTHRFDVELMSARRAEVNETCDRILQDLAGLSGVLHRSVLVNMAAAPSLVERLPKESVHHKYVQAYRSAPLLTHTFQEQPEAKVTLAMERLILDHLDEIVELCREHGVPLLLAANPWEYHVSAAPRVALGHTEPFPAENRLETVLRRRYEVVKAVEVLELTERLRQIPNPSGLFLDDPPNEIHWNATGHREVGTVLANHLSSRSGV